MFKVRDANELGRKVEGGARFSELIAYSVIKIK